MLPQAGLWLSAGGLTRRILLLLLFCGIGFTLPLESIWYAFRNLRLLLIIQASIWLLYPLLTLGLLVIAGQSLAAPLRTGILALAVLPTTVSSCIVYTRSAGGDTAGALVNAAIANVLGIMMTPALLALLLAEAGAPMGRQQISSVFQSLLVNMVLPLALGQVLRWLAPTAAAAGKKAVSTASSIAILFVLLFTLSESVADGTLAEWLDQLLPAILLMIALHALILGLILTLGRLLRLNAPQRVAALYTGSQKTLAFGVPLLSLFFADRPEVLAVALLPLLFYHPFQLAAGALFRPLITVEGEPE